jgi:hypothetical protein
LCSASPKVKPVPSLMRAEARLENNMDTTLGRKSLQRGDGAGCTRVVGRREGATGSRLEKHRSQANGHAARLARRVWEIRRDLPVAHPHSIRRIASHRRCN